VKRELERVPIPGEEDAAARAWAVLRAAFDERLPAPPRPRPARRRTLVVAAAACAIVLGVVAGTAGPALVRSVRQAVGLRAAAPALVRLPAEGRLLVNSGAGPWIVAADGSKRLLGRYASASWSPHGLFVVATRGHELAALDPKGNVRWSLERPGAVRGAVWSPDGYRIAYLAGDGLRVVAGDGTGDRLLAAHGTAPAWRPVGTHVLAYAGPGGIRVVDTDTGALLARWPAAAVTKLTWSADGRYLLVQSRARIAIRQFGAAGAVYERPAVNVTGAWSRSGHRLALVAYDNTTDRSSVRIVDVGGRWHQVFSGSGRIDGVAWSPDGRWLVLAWPTADQWLFARTTRPTRLRAIASISAQFHSRTVPLPAGWCC
jgi:WD40-like Beta Propeller Repeat